MVTITRTFGVVMAFSRISVMLSIGSACSSMALAGPKTVSFRSDIAPALKLYCSTCHLSGDEPGGLALHPGASYKALVNVPSQESKYLRVKPGHPEKSYFFAKITGKHLDAGGSGLRMPFGGQPLDPATIAKIKAWILQGAPNN